MNQFNLFIIRIILAFFFAVFISHFFPHASGINSIIILVGIMVSLAYFAEFLRNRKKK